MITLKAIPTKLAVLLLSVFMLLGCNKDDDSTTAPGSTPNSNEDTFLSAKIDGVDFEVQGLFYAADSDATGILYTYMSAENDLGTVSIILGISNLDGVGSYNPLDPATGDPLTDSYASGFFYREGVSTWSSIATVGANALNTIHITGISSSYIEGTFQFTGYNLETDTEKEITEGSFRFKRL